MKKKDKKWVFPIDKVILIQDISVAAKFSGLDVYVIPLKDETAVDTAYFDRAIYTKRWYINYGRMWYGDITPCIIAVDISTANSISAGTEYYGMTNDKEHKPIYGTAIWSQAEKYAEKNKLTIPDIP